MTVDSIPKTNTNDANGSNLSQANAVASSAEIIIPAETKHSRWKNFALDPAFLLYAFAMNLLSNTTTNLYMDRACSLNLNYSSEVCHNLNWDNNTAALNNVQVITSNYNLFSNLIRLTPSAILSIFIGPWSDKYGRKTPMYVSLVGTLVYNIGMVVYVSTPDAPIYQTLLYTIPQGLTGDRIGFTGCLYTMATDKTPEIRRPFKFAMLELSSGLGLMLGGLCAGLIYDKHGYLPVYYIALGCNTLLLVYVFFVLTDDSVKQPASVGTKCLEFFSCASFKENVNTALKKRENHGRTQICLLAISMSIISLISTAMGDVMFLYCKKVYHWDLAEYSVTSTITNLVGTGIMVVLVPLLTRVLRVPDQWLGFIGVLSLFGQSMVRAFAIESWLFYVGVAVGTMSCVAPLAIRSRLSRVVQKSELGKLFSVMATMEYLFPILGSLLYSQVYNASISFFPGLTFLVGGTTLAFPLATFVWLVRLKPTSSPLQEGEIAETETESEHFHVKL